MQCTVALFCRIGELAREFAIDIAAWLMNRVGPSHSILTQWDLKQEKSRLNTLVHEGCSEQAAFESRFNLLSVKRQRLFAILGTFGGADFSAEAAAATAKISLTEATAYLQEFFCLSLVRRGRPSHHYRLIPAIQTIAEEKSEFI